MSLQGCSKLPEGLRNSGTNEMRRFHIGDSLTVWPGLLQVLSRQQTLEADEVGVAVDRGRVGTGLDLLRFLRGERVGPAVPDVHLQLQQDLQRVLELHLAARAHIKRKSINRGSFISPARGSE